MRASNNCLSPYIVILAYNYNSNNMRNRRIKIIDPREGRAILISPAVLDNVLRDFEESKDTKVSLFVWATPILPLLTVLLTASEFRSLLGIEGEVWKALFLVAFYLFSVILIIKLIVYLILLNGKAIVRREDILSNLLVDNNELLGSATDNKVWHKIIRSLKNIF